MVFIGNSGGEYGVRGYIGAYDAETSKPLWRFYTVPGDPSKPFENDAHEESRRDVGAATGGSSAVAAPCGTPSSMTRRRTCCTSAPATARPGDQRKRDQDRRRQPVSSLSIIAVKPDTGEYVWHYQEVPGDTWDYDAVSPMMTVDITIDGKEQHVIVQPSKNGFFYILEAATGKLLRAEPFTEVNWADGVDMKTGRPRVMKEARYSAGKPFNLAPGVQGAHGWHSNAYDPKSGIIYMPTQLAYYPMVEDPNYKPSPVGYNLGIDFAARFTFFTDASARRNAASPATCRRGISRPASSCGRASMNEGPHGRRARDGGRSRVPGRRSGEARVPRVRFEDRREAVALRNADEPSQAAPITYELDGTQYVAVSVGGAAEGGLLRAELFAPARRSSAVAR